MVGRVLMTDFAPDSRLHVDPLGLYKRCFPDWQKLPTGRSSVKEFLKIFHYIFRAFSLRIRNFILLLFLRHFLSFCSIYFLCAKGLDDCLKAHIFFFFFKAVNRFEKRIFPVPYLRNNISQLQSKVHHCIKLRPSMA